MDVGTEIRQVREAKGWSQAKLAGEADMGVSGISQIETGTRNPSVATLAKIAEALGVGVADLFPKAQAPLPDLDDGQRRLDHAALAAWVEYLDLTLERWEELHSNFRDLANREPDEENDADDLLYLLVRSHEFFKAVERFCKTGGGLITSSSGASGTSVESRVLANKIRWKVASLEQLSTRFLDYSERLELAVKEAMWIKHEVEAFLDSVQETEVPVSDVL